MATIFARDRIGLLGDSITAGLPNPWWTPLQTACTNFYTNLYGAGSPKIPQWFNLGVVSDTAALVDARTGQLDDKCPTVCFNQVVVNDCSGATANSSFVTSYTSILNKQRTRWPRIRIISLGVLLWQEDWPSGVNPYDTVATGIDVKNNLVKTICESFGGEYVDMRQQYTTAMPAANPGHAQQGIWTLDKIHPNVTGQAIWSSVVQAQVQFSPLDFPISRPWQGT